MTYVMLMSTNQDIVTTQLVKAWDPIAGRYSWAQVIDTAPSLDLPSGATIVVIAHGDNDEIGNQPPGTIDINASVFLALITSNMAQGAMPGSIYISACAKSIAGFAASVRLGAQANKIWKNTKIYGHTTSIVGDVPSPNSVVWTEIF